MLGSHVEKGPGIAFGAVLDFPLTAGLLFSQLTPVFEAGDTKVCYLQDRLESSYGGEGDKAEWRAMVIRDNAIMNIPQRDFVSYVIEFQY